MWDFNLSPMRVSLWPTTLVYHIYSVYLTCASNIWDIIVPGYLFGVSNASIAPQLSMGPSIGIRQALASTPSMLLWSLSNLFLFCLYNQKQPETIAEDARNKPWRPIPTGRFTPEHAKYILLLMHPFCLAVALAVGGLVPYIILTLLHIWYNEFGGASNGILKNILNAVGFTCFFAGPLEVVTGRSILSGNGNAIIWHCILMATFATTSHAQDFRDMEGDRAAGRQTLPLTVGDSAARISIVIGVLGWTEIGCWYWKVGWLVHGWPALFGAVLMVNLLIDRSKEGDSRTWRLWSLWVHCLVMLPVMKERGKNVFAI